MTERRSAGSDENLRHALVALPLGLVVLLVGLVGLDGSTETGAAVAYVGGAALIYGGIRLIQGLYKRVGSS